MRMHKRELLSNLFLHVHVLLGNKVNALLWDLHVHTNIGSYSWWSHAWKHTNKYTPTPCIRFFVIMFYCQLFIKQWLQHWNCQIQRTFVGRYSKGFKCSKYANKYIYHTHRLHFGQTCTNLQICIFYTCKIIVVYLFGLWTETELYVYWQWAQPQCCVHMLHADHVQIVVVVFKWLF